MFVLRGELCHLSVCRIEGVQLVGTAHGVSFADDTVAQQVYAVIVEHTVGELLHIPFQRGAVDHFRGMPYAGEVERL